MWVLAPFQKIMEKITQALRERKWRLDKVSKENDWDSRASAIVATSQAERSKPKKAVNEPNESQRSTEVQQ